MHTLRAGALALLLTASPVGADEIREIRQAARDLVYDPIARRIYASVPGSASSIGNSVTVIDPATGAIGPSVFVGSEPGRLALSDDGRFLYVALDGASAVRRVELPTLAAGLQFSLGRAPGGGPYTVANMEVLPGQPRSLAVLQRASTSDGAGVVIYDDGHPRPRQIPSAQAPGQIVFSASAARLYGSYDHGIRRMTVDSSGVLTVDDTPPFLGGPAPELRFADGLLYADTGAVVDPEAPALIGSFPVEPGVRLIAPDLAANRVFFLTGIGATWTLAAFDPFTFLPVGSLSLPGVSGTPGSLVRWGEDGLAFRLSSSRNPAPGGSSSSWKRDRATRPAASRASSTRARSCPSDPCRFPTPRESRAASSAGVVPPAETSAIARREQGVAWPSGPIRGSSSSCAPGSWDLFSPRPISLSTSPVRRIPSAWTGP